METVAKLTEKQVFDAATKIVSSLTKPEEIARVDVSIGPDHMGEESLWFRLVLKPDAADDAEAIKHLSAFSYLLGNKVFEKELGLFPYTTIESPE